MPLLTQISWPEIIAGCLGTSAAVIANVISLVMIGKINERVPESERLSYRAGVGPAERKRFKRLYPESRLVLSRRAWQFGRLVGYGPQGMNRVRPCKWRGR